VSDSNDSERTILVVDDTLDIRRMLSEGLRQKGYRVITAANGHQAVEFAQSARPDVILMDLNLPVLDGLATTSLIREYAQLNKVPILAITAYDMSGMKEAALAAGCNAYIPKPIDLERLGELLSDILGSHNAGQGEL